MVSLTNQARLLAAQEFNRRVLQSKLAAGKRVTASASRIGVLTGRIARTSERGGLGRVTGITKTKSSTRLTSERLLRSEIDRQARLASRETDLEIFLKNERRLSSGTLTLSQVKRDIARRKAKGLSKTPAQRAALIRAQSKADTKALGARVGRKKLRGIRPSLITTPRETLAIKRTESERARGLGSGIFADPLGRFGGRSRAEVIERGGTFGRRAGGEAFGTSLEFVRGARVGSAQRRIGFAQSLLGDPFGGAASSQLLGIIDSQTPSKDPVKRRRGALTQRRLAPRAFENILREGVGVFETEAIPFTERDAPKTRKAALAARKRQDIARVAGARREIGRPRDDFERISVLGTQIIEPRTRKTKAGIDPRERRLLAEQTQRETQALRDAPFGQPPSLTQATGRPTRTQTFSPVILPTSSGRQLSIVARDVLGFSESATVSRPKAKKKGAKRPARGERISVLGERITERPRRDQSFLESIFGGELVGSRASGVSIGVGESVQQAERVGGNIFDFSNIFGTGRSLARGELLRAGETTITVGQAVRASPASGLFDFFNFFR